MLNAAADSDRTARIGRLPRTSSHAAPASTNSAPSPRLACVLGVNITDVSMDRAVELMESAINAADRRCHSVYLVNAHTLNLAIDDPDFCSVLNGGDYVFNDGTGVRWAARQRGIELRDNLCGTDLTPTLFETTAGRGYRYFLLGADPRTIEVAANYARQRFPGWTSAGFHHGYVHNSLNDAAIEAINAARADLLLVGMGNPLQERWIHQNRARLQVPLAVGVGGLFDLWAGNPPRAPRWVRRASCEWMYLLLRQPYKWRRYVIGNPKFLIRMTRHRRRDVAVMQALHATVTRESGASTINGGISAGQTPAGEQA